MGTAPLVRLGNTDRLEYSQSLFGQKVQTGLVMRLWFVLLTGLSVSCATPAADARAAGPQGPTSSRHWAYQAVTRPPLPDIDQLASVANPVDQFVLARLRRGQRTFTPSAPRAVRLRRVTLDLIGLPPSLDEVDRFLADPRPDAWGRVIDRLLASPAYGEHWGRYWLDLARYADTNGYNIDVQRPIWPYRDWVINTLNADLSFDQFTVSQIAGDLLPAATPAQRIATGFHRNTMINQEGGVDPEADRVKTIVDRVNTTATVWLGTTLACAHCHDHMYDPFTQREFFAFYAFFNQTQDVAGGVPNSSLEPLLRIPSPEQQMEWDRLRSALAHLPEGQTAAREKLRQAETALLESIPNTMVLQERSQRRITRVHLRGDVGNPGEVVTPGVPAVLHSFAAVVGQSRPPNRLDLARWLVASDNPLTGRVTVNRYWQRFFGTGLVTTSDDFGKRGHSPSHPALLDWLAREFVDTGWRVKAMHRLIATSRTYQQAARGPHREESLRPAQSSQQGPSLAGPWWDHGPRFRLAAETIRDLALAASGLLNRQIGGPSVHPPQPAGFWLEFGTRGFGMEKWPTSAAADCARRGLYTFWRRTTVYPTFAILDAPSREHCTVRRPRSNTPLQALSTLNDPAFLQCAAALALRAIRADHPNQADRIVFAFRLCLSRRPQPTELARLVTFYEQQLEHYRNHSSEADKLIRAVGLSPITQIDRRQWAAWTILASLLLNLDETITKG